MNNTLKTVSENRCAKIDLLVSKCRRENSDLPESRIKRIAAEKLIRSKCARVLLPDIAINSLGAVPVISYVIYDTAGIAVNFWYVNNAQEELAAELHYLFGMGNIVIDDEDSPANKTAGLLAAKEFIWTICAKITRRAGIVAERTALRGAENAGKWFLRKKALSFLPIIGAAAGTAVDIGSLYKHGKNIAAKLMDKISREQ